MATLSLLLGLSLALAVGALPAEATVSTLCRGYSGCAKLGMGNDGYSSAGKKMYWRMYAGHNCTNYAAYRMIRAGMPNTRPWTGSGNATYWGSKMSSITNSTPTVGSIAWWKAGVKPAGRAGHVAYVERVVSPTEIVLSQDSWNGDFSWTRVTKYGSGWPSGFIHFRDAKLQNTAAPSVSGTAKVGETLSATSGSWNPASVSLAYQWLADGAPIRGATGTLFNLDQAQQGKAISVRVTGTSPGLAPVGATSAATAPVQGDSLASSTRPSVTGVAQVGQTVVANPGSWSPRPDQLRYQWRVDGTPIKGATRTELALTPAHLGKRLSVAVTAVKAGYPNRKVFSPATPPVAQGVLPRGADPTVRGTLAPGSTLTVATPGAAADLARTFQWLRSGQPIPGATQPDYEMTPADLGQRMRVLVTFTRTGYEPLVRSSRPTKLVRTEPVFRLAVTPGKRRVSFRATVQVADLEAFVGKVQVRRAGKTLRTFKVVDGTAQGTVTRVPKGLRTYRFRLQTTRATHRVDIVRRLRVY